MDITSVSTLLGSIKAATDIAKLIKESDVSLQKAEVKLKLAELISALADAKLEAADVQQALHAALTQVRELEAAQQVQAALAWQSPYYWHVKEGIREGPYCQHCYDKARHLIRLQGNGTGLWSCTVCKNSFADASYRAKQDASIQEFKNRPRPGY